MTLNHILYEATMEVLEGLGEEVMQSLTWQLGMEGVSFVPDTFDIKAFSKGLKSLFGEGADSLVEEIYQNVLCRLESIRPVSLLDSNDGIDASADNVMQSPLRKLLTLFGDSPSYNGDESENKE